MEEARAKAAREWDVGREALRNKSPKKETFQSG